MTIVFIVCAAAGGTIMVVQFLLTLVGLGGHAFDVDVSHDFGGDFHGDAGGDFHGDFHGDATLQSDHGGDADHAIHHGSAQLFRILSFRAVVAALAFFGLAGLAAQSAKASTLNVIVVAVAAGATALFGVYWLMQSIQKLRAEGTVRIERAVGRHGDVYLRVPAAGSGAGKVQVEVQGRTMEYLAVTAGAEIPTGAKVVVGGVVNPTTLEVQAET
jgi:hypothetical protein